MGKLKIKDIWFMVYEYKQLKEGYLLAKPYKKNLYLYEIYSDRILGVHTNEYRSDNQ
ncbi:MAG: hypothetical protein J5U19_02105 [Candidatus Methanoperedens sp.]|nr:hypothetical protein [Candidatus Methanoperedens sp.]